MREALSTLEKRPGDADALTALSGAAHTFTADADSRSSTCSSPPSSSTGGDIPLALAVLSPRVDPAGQRRDRDRDRDRVRAALRAEALRLAELRRLAAVRAWRESALGEAAL